MPSPAPLRFRGSPTQLATLLPAPGLAEAPAAVELNLPKLAALEHSVAVHQAERTDAAGPAWVKLRLPKSTPPGTYEGTMRIGDREQSVVVEIEPHPHLRLAPRRLLLRADAGAKLDVGLSIVNAGNVPHELRTINAVGLFDVEGAERAIGRAFRAGATQQQRLVDRLAAELAEGYGGLAKLVIEEGAGELAPGAGRELRVNVQLPDKLLPGHAYDGVWTLANVNYVIVVEVPGKAPNEKEAG